MGNARLVWTRNGFWAEVGKALKIGAQIAGPMGGVARAKF